MTLTCPHCGNDDPSMLEEIGFTARPGGKNSRHPDGQLRLKHITYLCVSCSKEFNLPADVEGV